MPTRRIAIMLGLDWPYKRHVGIFEGTQHYALEHGWHCDIDEFADQTLHGCTRRNMPYQGIIARATSALATVSARLRLPVVNVWVSSPARQLPCVKVDASAMGRQRAEHLLDRGFKRFASLTRTDDVAQDEEVAAFVQRIAEAGLPCPVTTVPTGANAIVRSRRNFELTAKWVNKLQTPVALFIYDEHAARHVVQLCRSRNLVVPHDVAIVAGYNEDALCSHPQPGLTSMEVGYHRIGYEAARMLDRLMSGGAAPTRSLVLPPIGLVVRESTDFHAVDDALVAAALRYISSHLREPIGVSDIADAVGTSRRKLEFRFRDKMDRSIATEVRRLRLELAKRRLAESDIPIANVARETGYATASRMCQAFRNELGTTPLAYRKQLLARKA